jgi:formylglycine-generating enzyme required for sulfatase activity
MKPLSPFFFYCLCVVALLLSCGNVLDTPGRAADRGGLAVSLLFKRQSPVMQISTQVKTVELCVSGAGFDTAARWPYSAGQGEILRIPVGMVNVRVNGLNIGGDTLYAGDTTVVVKESEVILATVTLASTCPAGMTLISGGTFQMGSALRTNEQPVHSVTVSSFYMDTTEVTQADYLIFMGANPSYFTGDTKRPVEQVTWFDAVLYCNKRSKQDGLDTVYQYAALVRGSSSRCTSLVNIQIDYTRNGYRLPTEAEWEYACRASTTTDYYWGKNYSPYPATTADSAEVGRYCVWYGNSWSLGSGSPDYGTHAVATKLPNAYGLYDMCGNQSEWCNDWYDSTYYTSGTQFNPKGAGSGLCRVVRGYSWNNTADGLRSAIRTYSYPDDRFGWGAGFRCVRPRH